MEKSPDSIAIVFEDQQLSYAELNRRANQLAHYLLNLKTDTRHSLIGLCMERSIPMVTGLLGILKSGGAYVPLDPEYPLSRLSFMLDDSALPVLLCLDHLLERLPESTVKVVCMDRDWETISACSTENPKRKAGPEDLAYVIYTSGSTGKPKGTLLTHKSLSNYLNWSVKAYNPTQGIGVPVQSSIAFDATITSLYLPLISGSRVFLIPGKKEIEGLAELMNGSSRLSFIKITPAHLEVLNQQLEQGGFARSAYALVIGGEALTASHIQPWLTHAPQVRLINEYGPTESVVGCCTYDAAGQTQLSGNVPVGRPIANTRTAILDVNHNPTPPGIPGELCIAGTGLARGYLNRPQLTAEKFVKIAHDFVYKTGDFARWLTDGNIEFLGRIDYQVKIRGYRIEPGEIEVRLRAFDRVGEAVVLSRDSGGENMLCGYVTLANGEHDSPVAEADLKMYLESCLPSYMVPARIVVLDEMPLNANGKLDRNALPEPISTAINGGDHGAPESQLMQTLVEIWADVLKTQPENIGADDDFFRLGGHSLRATLMVARIHKLCGVKLALTEVFKSPTIRALAAKIDEAEPGSHIYASIQPAEKREYYHASPLQRRMFVLDRMTDGQTPYNMPYVITIKGPFDSQPFERAFQRLVNRHESLRSFFQLRDGVPVQVVREDVRFSVDYFDADGRDIPELVAGFVRPFDLGHAPLLRVAVGTLPDNEHLWLLDMHHIISDGTSITILTREFMQLYADHSLPPLRIQYKDVCQWRHTREGKKALKAQEAYWLKRFEGDIPVLNMITDFPRPSVQSFEGNALFMEIKEPQFRKIEGILETTGATLYILLLTLLNILLARYTGQQDIVVGSTVSGRDHADLENLLGMFINPLPIRNYPHPDKTVEEFLLEVKENTLSAYENQGYHYSELVEKLDVADDVSRNPLYDVELILQNMETQVLEIGELQFVPFETENSTAQLDLSFSATRHENRVAFSVVYCTRLYKRETVNRLIQFFQHIIRLVTDDLTVKIGEIEMPHELGLADVAMFKEDESDFDF